jgi:hemerythrin-like domain-containing protein
MIRSLTRLVEVYGRENMSRTRTFKRQHGELRQLAAEIRELLLPEAIERDAREVRTKIARFAGKLRVHTKMENEALYPELLSHHDEHVRTEAKRLLAELGPIYAQFDAYETRWKTAEALQADPRHFVLETLALYETLAHRMRTEDARLYTLVEQSKSLFG